MCEFRLIGVVFYQKGPRYFAWMGHVRVFFTVVIMLCLPQVCTPKDVIVLSATQGHIVKPEEIVDWQQAKKTSSSQV